MSNEIETPSFIVYWHEKEEDSDRYKMTTIGINWEIDEENNQALVHMMENKSMNDIPEDRREDAKKSIKKQLKEYSWSGEVKII